MIAIVVPTIRPKHLERFKKAWQKIFEKHECRLVIVQDGENPTVNGKNAQEIMGKYADSLTNFNAGIRNLGFAYVAKKLKGCEIIITLDDDVTPIGDPIQDHIDALNKKVPVSWISTASEYTRGFPYSIREEAETVISHGIWEGSCDWDAPTQLVLGEKRPVTFYKGPIPKGIYYPMCSMNLAFKRKVLPYIFHAPWSHKIHRFDDIFAGIISKREVDKHGWAVVSGYARVNHEKASDPFKNLEHEAPGITLNESFWKGDEDHPYFENYRKRLKLWQEFIAKTESLETSESKKVAKEEEKQKVEPPKPEKPRVETPKIKKQEEMDYWREWLEGNGKAYEKLRRLSPSFNFMIGDKKEVLIANLGAGPLNLIGDDRRHIKAKVLSSDILANEYAKLLKEFDINPQNPVEKQDMQSLTYEDNTFDIVYCANALNNVDNAPKALQEMLRVCKPEGYVYLRHIVYEEPEHHSRGLHKWHLEITPDGDCAFWNNNLNEKKKVFLLTSFHPNFITTSEILAKGKLITSYVQKR